MAQTIDDFLIHVHDAHGHVIYLRHPRTREIAEVGHAANRKDADDSFRKLRRVMAGIVYEVAAQTLRREEKS